MVSFRVEESGNLTCCAVAMRCPVSLCPVLTSLIALLLPETHSKLTCGPRCMAEVPRSLYVWPRADFERYRADHTLGPELTTWLNQVQVAIVSVQFVPGTRWLYLAFCRTTVDSRARTDFESACLTLSLGDDPTRRLALS
eukprot:2836346-Rhodomonas_salina.4